jgi:hypothetical protein
MEFTWEDDAIIATSRDDVATVITANAAGLRTLAGHLLVLAGDDAVPGSHLHLDQTNGLVDGSIEIVLVRDDRE